MDYVTGGNADRLAKAKIAGANAESDLTVSTSHWAWLYETGNLSEEIDYTKLRNASDLFPQARLHKTYVGVWSYVYSIGYRPDMVPAGINFESWKDLWDPRLKGLVGLHRTDPSHIIIATTRLAGADTENWEKAQPLLRSLKSNVKAYFASDAQAEELLSRGEAPVLVMLSSTALLIGKKMNMKYAIPKEGGVAAIDIILINKGTKKRDLAHKFIDVMLDPEVQASICNKMWVGPMNSKARLLPDVAALPGVFTTSQQWKDQAIVVEDKVRAEKLSVWREWVAENMHQ